VILADTAVWIDFFRQGQPELRRLLEKNQVAMHPCIVAELALGSVHDRLQTLARLDNMPQLRMVSLPDVRQMIEARGLFSMGIGLTDAHLVASCLTAPGTLIWTTDARLGKVAESLSIRADLP